MRSTGLALRAENLCSTIHGDVDRTGPHLTARHKHAGFLRLVTSYMCASTVPERANIERARTAANERVIPRREALLVSGALAMGWSRAVAAEEEEEEEEEEVVAPIKPTKTKGGSAGPVVTDKVFFEFKIAGRTKALENPKWEKIIARDKRASGYTEAEFSQGGTDSVVRVVFGLYGKEAPKTVETFLQLAKGELMAPCIDEDDAVGDPEDFSGSQRSKLTKRQIYKQCKAQEDKPVGYEYSQIWRVVKDKRIDLGRINKQYRQAPFNDDENALQHRFEAVEKQGRCDKLKTRSL